MAETTRSQETPGRSPETWPPLPLEDWEQKHAALHRCLQVIGKLRLANTSRLRIVSSDGGVEEIALEPQSVARCYGAVQEALRSPDIPFGIRTQRAEIAGALPFEVSSCGFWAGPGAGAVAV